MGEHVAEPCAAFCMIVSLRSDRTIFLPDYFGDPFKNTLKGEVVMFGLVDPRQTFFDKDTECFVFQLITPFGLDDITQQVLPAHVGKILQGPMPEDLVQSIPNLDIWPKFTETTGFDAAGFKNFTEKNTLNCLQVKIHSDDFDPRSLHITESVKAFPEFLKSFEQFGFAKPDMNLASILLEGLTKDRPNFEAESRGVLRPQFALHFQLQKGPKCRPSAQAYVLSFLELPPIQPEK
jgi:hypothetical protein